MWFEGSVDVTKRISINSSDSRSLFITATGDIYVDNGQYEGRVNKWTLNSTTGVPAMYIGSRCYSLFVDIRNTLYCSMGDLHQVVTKSLKNGSIELSIVGGTGCAGSASNMLFSPQGIFVDINFDLYVADCNNHRIQFFPSGQLTGTTIAGNTKPDTITLNCPTGVTLDADNYLFIVDSRNHRIVGSGSSGFRCLVGCFGGGSTLDRLSNPQTMVFDRYGNMFVTDHENSRIQKFILLINSCGKYPSIKLYIKPRTLLYVETFLQKRRYILKNLL